MSIDLSKSPSRKRIRDPQDNIRDECEAKRRRSSLPYASLARRILPSALESEKIKPDGRDRFLPSLTTTKPFYAINAVSPRSKRVAQAMGFIKPKILSYTDEVFTPLLNRQLPDPLRSTRISLMQSLIPRKQPGVTYSAAKYGSTKPDRVLDSGPMDDFALHPCVWSSPDEIAAIIRGRVFTHSLETNRVRQLPYFEPVFCVDWISRDSIITGAMSGVALQLDTTTDQIIKHMFPNPSGVPADNAINAVSWSKQRDLLAVGRESGCMTYYDMRREKMVKQVHCSPKDPVMGVKWNPNGDFIASGHESGIVRCMDWRTNKVFELKPPLKTAAHKKLVKSLAWAPWNPNLLATGGHTSDHTVRLWSLSNSSATSTLYTHTHSLSFTSEITSLHFSAHATELLSTHGEAVVAPSKTRTVSHRRLSRHSVDNQSNESQSPPTRHGILVHAYPSLDQVHCIKDAHGEPIVDGALSPDGTSILTFGEDETLRIWSIWGERRPEKTLNVMDQCKIR
ncbi:WD40-repeat-containing domain protein [Hysterangium stoloniferum]|nr:WD40-repeat-containing domain protein [Hysterangium stoloniferum]